MKTSLKTLRKDEKGFTLVELAIVLIIIGLLIGGILKGQELIANAQITNAVSQIKGVDGAVATFRETYAAFPGDLGNATNRIAGCDADSACDDPSNGTQNNGRIDAQIGAAPAATGGNEDFQFWQHMRVADLITGFTGVGTTVNFGQSYPSASIGGGFTVGHTTAGATGFTPVRAGHYIVLTGSISGTVDAGGAGVLTASQAARIDRKLDDGSPNSGSVYGIDAGTSGSCADDSSVTTPYNEAQSDPLCNLAIRIQG